MAEASEYGPLPANMPESVRARLMAARLLQQGAAQQTAPYTSQGVTALKAIEGLMGWLQERSAINEAQQGQADQRRMLASLLLGNASPAAMASGAPPAAPRPTAAGMIPGSAPTGPVNALPAGDAATRDLAIRTIYGEAGGEPAQGQAGVAAVLKNRLAGGQYGSDMQSVIMAPKQFSLWNKGDPAGDSARRLDASSPAYQKIGSIYDGVMSGDIADPTGGATHYYNPNVASPNWGPKLAAQNDVRIGNHRFVGTGPAGPNGMAAAMPAPNAQPVSSDTLPPGVTPDMVSAPPASPSPYGAMPTSMAQAPAQPDTAALAAALRGSAASPLPATVQPSSPFGAMPQSMDQAPAPLPSPTLANVPPPAPQPSPFGAGPQPMQSQAGPDQKALAAALLRQGQSAPAPAPAVPMPDPTMAASPDLSAMLAPPDAAPMPAPIPDPAQQAAMALPSPDDPVGGMMGTPAASPSLPDITTNAMASAGYDTAGLPGAVPPAPQAAPAAPAALVPAPLPPMQPVPGSTSPTEQLNATDYALSPTGTRDQFPPNPRAPGLNGMASLDPTALSPFADPSASPMMPATGPTPPPGAQTLAAALRGGVPGGSAPLPTAVEAMSAPTPLSPPTAPFSPPPAAGQQTASLLPGSVDDFGRTPDQAMANPSDVAGNATRAMQAAGMDVTGLPGAPKPPLPAMAGANVPPPDLSGLAGSPKPPPGSGMPIMARPSSNPPAALQQDFAGLGQPQPGTATSPEPSSRPGAQAARQPGISDAPTVPLPPIRPSNHRLLGLNPDAPAPGAAQAGPAPASSAMLASLLAQQPNGINHDGGGDQSSPMAFMRQEAARAAGGSYSNPTARALAGQTMPAPTSPAPTSGQDDGNPLAAIGRLFGQSGGNSLAGLPIVGDLFKGGGPGGQTASSPAYGGQPAGAGFTPGGQGAPAGQSSAGQGQASSGATAGGMNQAQMIALLSNPYTTPQEAEFIINKLSPKPIIQETKDGKIVAINPGDLTTRTLYAGQGYRPATADERRSYGITDDRPFSFGPDGKPEIGTVDPNAKETNEQRDYRQVVTEAQSAGQKAPSFADYQTSLRHAGSADPGPAGMVFSAVKEQRDGAMAAAQALPSFQQANAAIKSGAILGAGADKRLDVAKALSLFGYKDQGDAAANTEVFRSAVAPVVLSTVKSLGAGSGISNADRDFAEKAAGGNINLEPQAIQRLLDIGERAANAKVAAYNATLDGTYPASDPKNGQVRQLFQLRMPDAGLPAAPAPAAPQAPAPVAALAPVASPAAPQGGGYLPGAARGPAATPPQQQPSAPVQGARQAPNGNWYVADPNRPGKYMMVQ